MSPGDYLTDGLRLFRVASRVAGGGQLLLGLEDCLTLEVGAYAVEELDWMGLQIVRCGRDGGPRDRRSVPSGLHGCD